MRSQAVSYSEFETLVETSETLVVRFVINADEIEQDQILTSVIPSVVTAYCDVRKEPALAKSFGVVDESALLIFRQRIILYFEKGFHDLDKISYLMQRISMLDMDKIRENIEKEKVAQALHLRRACPITRAKLIQ